MCMKENSFEMGPTGDELMEVSEFIEDMEPLSSNVPEEMQEYASSFEAIQNTFVKRSVEQEEDES